jgi:hypothetical protein
VVTIAEFVGIYGAGLATWTVWSRWVTERSRIQVDLLLGVEEGDEHRSGIFVTVKNLSPHDIHLQSVEILYRWRRLRLRDCIAFAWQFKMLPRRISWCACDMASYAIETRCPIRVPARAAHQVFIDDSAVERILARAVDRRLLAVAQDQLWRSVYSRPLTVAPAVVQPRA